MWWKQCLGFVKVKKKMSHHEAVYCKKVGSETKAHFEFIWTV